jgi:hypothetical protein
MDDSERWVRHRGFLPDTALTDELDENDEAPPAIRRRHRRLRPRPTRRRVARVPRVRPGATAPQMSDRD